MTKLAQLIRAVRLGSLHKAAVVVGVPPSSLTIRSEIAKNGPTVEPNEYTREDQRYLTEKLQTAVPPVRRKMTFASMAGRNSVQRRTP